MDRPDLAYLTRGDDAPARVAVGGLLAVLGVTWPLLLGYAVGVVRATFRGESVPPAIDEWAPILRDGVIASTIVGTFALPPVIVALLADWRPGGSLTTGAFAAVAVIALVSAYALPAALARFAHRGTLVAGLDAWTILDVVLLPTYARTWFGVAIVASILLGGAWVLPSLVVAPGLGVATWIVATLLGYAVVVLAGRAIGHTYADIMRLEADASGLTRRSSIEGGR